jgi:hypothetical protein
VIAGEAGIGKTALVEDAARYAAVDAAVVWGVCVDGPGVPALWPWPQVLAELGGPPLPGPAAPDEAASGDDRWFAAATHTIAALRRVAVDSGCSQPLGPQWTSGRTSCSRLPSPNPRSR